MTFSPLGWLLPLSALEFHSFIVLFFRAFRIWPPTSWSRRRTWSRAIARTSTLSWPWPRKSWHCSNRLMPNRTILVSTSYLAARVVFVHTHTHTLHSIQFNHRCLLDVGADEYVAKLDKILARKNESTVALRSRLALFKTHLREEERLSNSFTRQ